MESNSEKKIKVLPNGPYEVIGDVPVNQLRYIGDRKGASTGYKEIQKHSVEGVYHLCRCGGSHNKPFCDGTHKRLALKEIRQPVTIRMMKCLSFMKVKSSICWMPKASVR